MPKYFKDNFDWDLGMYLSQIHLAYSKVSDSIKQFSDCLKKIEEKPEPEIEIIEDFGSIQINDELINNLTTLSDNLKNEAFFNSLLVSAYSYFEFGLVELCRLMNEYKKKGRSYEKFRNPGMDKVKVFIKSSFDINVEKIDNWAELDKHRILRNLVVHNNSNIIRKPGRHIEKQKDYKSLGKNDNLEITSAGYVFIKNMDYIKKLIDSSLTVKKCK